MAEASIFHRARDAGSWRCKERTGGQAYEPFARKANRRKRHPSFVAVSLASWRARRMEEDAAEVCCARDRGLATRRWCLCVVLVYEITCASLPLLLPQQDGLRTLVDDYARTAAETRNARKANADASGSLWWKVYWSCDTASWRRLLKLL